MAFKAVKNNQNLVDIELEKMKFWREHKTFAKSLQNREKAKKVVFFDGPPFANGLPHYGHMMIGSLKDAMARFWTMKGFSVPRVAGWDCHGLPVEYEIEKQFGLAGKQDIEKMGTEKFNQACRESVFKYTNEWEEVMDRFARWVDFENGYATLENDYMESIWWVFKQIWAKGLVYEGAKAMQICPRCETPLSNFEVTQGYKDITDLSVTIKFALKDQKDTYFLAWTTTPWSVASVMGLAINKDIDYVKVKADDGFYILAESRLEAVFNNSDRSYEIVEKMKGADLVGQKYQHVFDYYDRAPEVLASEKAFSVVATEYASDQEGTGIVTINGAFGEEDMMAAKENGLPMFVNVAMNGNYLPEVKDFAGKFVKGQDQNIAAFLEKKGNLFKKENYRHSYPHCWRCDTPLLNYSTKAWFIKVTEVKDKMLVNNQKINWQPPHLKDGRFGKWLEGARDWNISRNRYWGCPIPIWRNEYGDMMAIGSMEELKNLTGGVLPKDLEGKLDLHKPYIDQITFVHPDRDPKDEKALMKRISDVFDCWFESGSMPYAQLHYPFENKKEFEGNFPADFIIEAIDQTRGWFYTLHVLSTILFDKPAANNIVCTGHVNAADGEKLSKSKKNYPDPTQLFASKGVDAVRFYLYQSPVVVGDGVRFSEQHVDEFLKKFNLTIWNTYSFFVTYANIDGWAPDRLISPFKPKHALDKWILSELNALIQVVGSEMEGYNMMKATRPMVEFVDNLSNWYVRRSRRRFWKSENDQDKDEAYQTLYTALVIFSRMLAPFMPFMAEEIYQNLTGNESVHLTDWPEFRKQFVDKKINQQNFMVRSIVALGHQIRAKNKIKVRQPLSKVEIALPDGIDLKSIKSQIDVIAEELNVKEVEFLSLDE
ncbi:isoleucine--tRNA ligase, partial [Candidatus Peregrinibacteria bacterium]|nr:isoleucine--tRNA ligase [Candidatus Peregrinibacteria bacterium]